MIILDSEPNRKWKNRDELILEEYEVDIKIRCDCGEIGYMCESDVVYGCASCKRVYRVVLSVEQEA